MVNIQNIISRFKVNGKKKIKNIKNKTRNGAQKFKENFYEAKSKPRSKRKSLLLGFATVLSIFGVVLVAPVLPAVAKDVPKSVPDHVCPAPSPKPALLPSQQIINGLSGAAGAVCALAISSGSFLIGGACGVIVVVGILKAIGK